MAPITSSTLIIFTAIFVTTYSLTQLCDEPICRFDSCNASSDTGITGLTNCQNNQYICTEKSSICSLTCVANCYNITILSSAEYTQIICTRHDACNNLQIYIEQPYTALDLQCTQSSSCQNINIHSHPQSTVECSGAAWRQQCKNNVQIEVYSDTPTIYPTQIPTLNPSLNPTLNPSLNPTLNPTLNPSQNPTLNPTLIPTQNPSLFPSQNPTLAPTLNPSPIATYTSQIPSYFSGISARVPTPKPTSDPTFQEIIYVTKTIIVYAEQMNSKSDGQSNSSTTVIVLIIVLISVTCICLAMYIKIYKYKRKTAMVPANQEHIQMHVKHCNVISDMSLDVCMEMVDIANVRNRNTSEGIIKTTAHKEMDTLESDDENRCEYNELYEGRNRTKRNPNLKQYDNIILLNESIINEDKYVSELDELPMSPMSPISPVIATSLGHNVDDIVASLSAGDLHLLYGPGNANNKTRGGKYEQQIV